MPKQRVTCTNCSRRRQKCDREKPCGRCVRNKEAHLCTTEWTNGYNPSIHRKYPKKGSSLGHQAPQAIISPTSASHSSPLGTHPWPITPSQDATATFRTRASTRSSQIATSGAFDEPDGPQEPTPNSTNVDFITFGRSDFSDISMAALLSSKDAYSRNKALMDRTLNQTQHKQFDDTATSGGFSAASRAVEAYYLQTLLPNKETVLKIVDYHQDYMLYWSGAIFHGPSFRRSLLAAYNDTDDINFQNMDWRWMALLFSILSATIIACPEAISASWGYTDADKARLAKQWGSATIASLQLGDYATKYHIYSIQAILNVHPSEHLVGSTKGWAVYQNGAIVIAKGLGLHKLSAHPEDDKPTNEMSPAQKNSFIQREMGRRVWFALASQDWLCSTSQGSYSIQKNHFTTIKPKYLDEETMDPVPDSKPTATHIGNYINDVAHLLIQFHDDMLAAQDVMSKYNVVLRYDARMRAKGEAIPSCLSMSTPFDPSWPPWLRWARRMNQASNGHKIIMIHQAFLNKSFKSQQFTYSRWACATAAKVIIDHLGQNREPEEPQWWVEQAFVVTAGICLVLDILHRSEKDPEVSEYLLWIEKTIKTLEKWPTSSVATHGVRLLTSLLQEYNKKKPDQQPTTTAPATAATSSTFSETVTPDTVASASSIETPGTVPETATDLAVPQNTAIGGGMDMLMDVWPIPVNGGLSDVDMLGFDNLMDSFPMDAGLDNNMFFESMLSLANSQFF